MKVKEMITKIINRKFKYLKGIKSNTFLDLYLKEKILNWDYILEPMQNKNHKEKYIKLFKDAQN